MLTVFVSDTRVTAVILNTAFIRLLLVVAWAQSSGVMCESASKRIQQRDCILLMYFNVKIGEHYSSLL